MDASRISGLLLPFVRSKPPSAGCDSQRSEEPAVLSPKQLQQISIYIDLLLRWNARVNLTAIRDPESIVTRHFGESLFAACRLFLYASGVRPGWNPSPATSRGPRQDLIDLGSGAGFPGLPIKIWAPHLHITLIESNHKKATFLREVIRTLTLTNIDVFNGRAEDFPSSSADTVTLRAVERFASSLSVAANLVRPSGRIALLIGDSQVAFAHQILPEWSWDPAVSIPLSTNRVLLVGTQPVKVD
jgi:16S rRNA (guanine527-N7)-methyltransferase